MKSIAARLTGLTLCLTGIVLIIVGVAVYLVGRNILRTQFDVALESRALSIASFVVADPDDGVEFEPADQVLPQFGPGQDADYFEIRLAGGRQLAASRSLGESTLTAPTDPGSKPRIENVTLPDGRAGRQVSWRFIVPFEGESENISTAGEESEVDQHEREPSKPVQAEILVAVGREPLDRSMRSLAALLAISGLVLCIAIPVVVRAAVQAGLHPMRRLNAEVESIDEHSLTTRVVEHDLPAEIAPTAARLNALLARLDQAFERERRFAASAAHELRTPVAELRTMTEVALRASEEDSAGARHVLVEVQTLAKEMSELIDALLALTKSSRMSASELQEAIDLGDLIAIAVARFEMGARERSISIEMLGTDGLTIRSSETHVRSIMLSLLSNAVRYAPQGEVISIHVRDDDRYIEIALSNHAPDLDAEDLPNLAEPFWKKDSSRASTGTGLGLAIAAGLAERIGAELLFDYDESQQRLTGTLRVPKRA